MADLLFLVGMMGAGKTTVGRLVAERLARDFVDTDAEIEARTGKAIGAIFAAAGEQAFRDEECRLLGELALRTAPAVVSVGGGAVIDERNRAAMRGAGTVVWLRADPAVLAARTAGEAADRPLLAAAGTDGATAALERLVEARRGWYEEVATVVVDVDELTPDEAASAVLGALGVGTA